MLSISSMPHSRSEVIIVVEESGPGIDPKEMNRIFDAFFTTKPQGMGMGLSICRSIIESHGGRLWASARHPNGSIFHVALPSTS
jgi:signal transduction histidine kinase